MVSCLCITTAEREKIFSEWVLWNYARQTIGTNNTELVVVTDGDGAIWPNWVRVAHVDGNIPTKRNHAIGMARGYYSTWFDDDDWQNPFKCSLAKHCQVTGIVGSSKSFFYDIFSEKVSHFNGRWVIFNSIIMPTRYMPEFNESIDLASDDDWMARLPSEPTDLRLTLHFWVSHGYNVTNRRDRISFTESAPDMGKSTWRHLRKLEKHFKPN